jgi:hypothetical protein
MKGWKIGLLALIGGLGATFTTSGLAAIAKAIDGGELGVAIGVALLITAWLLNKRWQA